MDYPTPAASRPARYPPLASDPPPSDPSTAHGSQDGAQVTSVDDDSLPHTANNPTMTDPTLAGSRGEPAPAAKRQRSLDYPTAGIDPLNVARYGGLQKELALGGTGNRPSTFAAGSASLDARPRLASSTPTSASRPAGPPLSIPSFPVLPPSIPSPSQTYQTPFQVSSILSLPAPLLLQLARTTSPAEQEEIAERAGRKEYLGSMALPPPSPTTLVNDIQRLGLTMSSVTTSNTPTSSDSAPRSGAAFAPTLDAPTSTDPNATSLSRRPSVQLTVPLESVTSLSSHPAIPLLLGQVFSPPTPGILAPIPGVSPIGETLNLAIRAATSQSRESWSQVGSIPSAGGTFEPVYASVEQWSYEVAKDQVFSSSRVHPSSTTTSPTARTPTSPSSKRPALLNSHSFNEREIARLAQEVKNWALAEQEKQVEQQVVESKSAAVVLAAQAAARQDGESDESYASFRDDVHAGTDWDFGEYAEAYKKQLDALASGYFAQLHRDALKRLVERVEEESQQGTLPASTTAAGSASASTASAAPSRSSTTSPVPVPHAWASASLPPRSSSHAPSLTSLTSLTQSRPQAEALHIQAAAAAAVAANVMAAKEIARHAGERLAGMGVDPNQIVQEVGIRSGGPSGRTQEAHQAQVGVGMRSLEISPDSIRAPSSSFATPPAGVVVPSQNERREDTAPPPEALPKDEMIVEDVGVVSAPIPGRAEPIRVDTDRLARSHGATASSPTTPRQPPSASQALDAQYPSPTSLPASKPPAPLSPSTSAASLADPTLLASVSSPQKRDYLLSYAHTLYSSDPASKELLPLLHTIESIHPDHLPTLLLISCVYYTRGQLESSLYYNKRLLAYDPNYVEAMSNIGTTLRAMGKWSEAETWWWKAIKLRPTYWDATENLLGVLCNPSSSAVAAASSDPPPPTTPRLEQALALCEYVEMQIYADPTSHSRHAVLPRPRNLPSAIPFNNIHRVQNLFYAKGNLRLALGDSVGAQDEYEKAIEVALALPEWAQRIPGLQYPLEGANTRDLVVVATVIGKILTAFAQSGANPSDGQLVSQMARQLGVADHRGGVPFDKLFRTVKTGGDAYVRRLLEMGGGVLPTVLLEPQLLVQFPAMLFPEPRATLPSMFDPALVTPPSPDGRPAESDPARASVIASTNQTTSTMLLTLAKVLQDSLGPTSPHQLSIGGVPASQSLLLPLYYVALALYPSPSTCNNLGILLSTMNATTLIGSQDPTKPPLVLTGQQLALKYYEAGLKLDPKHPHLYTNLGSLLKDMGQLPQAVAMYKRAVDFNPTFDVALANLANAVKDTGQIQESIPYYRRAVELNPNFPEAVCGLVNALGGVCDWQGRGGVGEAWIVDEHKNLVHAPVDQPRSGYMAQISNLVAKQLKDGLSYGQGSLRSYGGIEEWLAIISQALYNAPPSAVGEPMKVWRNRLTRLWTELDQRPGTINEGGYLIRLIERLMRRIQRRWYLEAYGYGAATSATPRITPTHGDVAKYRRPALPPSLPPIPVPTVLPFHCFTLPVTARETRLISHRTGLRISHSTLNQPWMPPIVYPPPRPPIDGKINLGYVSSDLGNHPLSHLMQSVFGYHDLDRFNVFVYATSPSDKSPYRVKIESESQHFVDVSSESTQQIVDRIVRDEIHVLINLSGYTKGARNEVFAARPAPVQMSYMGFASTLSAGWCDYFIVDPIVCPPSLVSGNQWRFYHGDQPTSATPARPTGATDFEGDLDPESPSESYVYTEKLIYLPHSYFVTDHKQAWREADEPRLIPSTPEQAETLWAIEEDKRWAMRRQMFPDIRDDTVIFANWNQLYKIDPFIYKIWLSILKRFPNSILWLLRFPAPGEAHLKETARQWAGDEVANRVVFTDVANKNEHIHRGRIADLFLDTTECNAHTTAADILWSGTPILTFPRHGHKMCSRVAASIAVATGFGPEMIVSSPEAYEERAVALASGLTYRVIEPVPGALPESVEGKRQRRGVGELAELRKKLFLTRESSPLFDTKRWTVNLEKGLVEAWHRWVRGTEFEDSPEWQQGGSNGHASAPVTPMTTERQTSCIWVADDHDATNIEPRQPYFL
ncbi:hypothetical protein JCM10212_004639 [Sporobolomyces blumeae]